MQRSDELVCGCVIGYFLCPEAEQLWRDAMRMYEELKRRGTLKEEWHKYEEARARYDQHFQEQEEIQ